MLRNLCEAGANYVNAKDVSDAEQTSWENT